MSNALVSLFFAVGAGAWIYAKTLRSTGGNTANAILLAGLAGFLLFVAMMLALGSIFK